MVFTFTLIFKIKSTEISNNILNMIKFNNPEERVDLESISNRIK